MITLTELYDYKRKVERELVMAEAKMSVIDDLIAEEEKKPTIETQEVYGFDEENPVTETVETETKTTY